jgi:hypothetical protein
MGRHVLWQQSPSSARFARSRSSLIPAIRVIFAASVRPRRPRRTGALRFSNEDASGRFDAEYADTGEPYLGHEYLVNGVKCYADKARFGGIVIEAMV